MTEPFGWMSTWIVFREEELMWNCYVDFKGFVDPILMGSIPLKSTENPARKEAFMSLIKDIYGDFCEDTYGSRPVFGDPLIVPDKGRNGSS